jgi:hypothetical protein
MTDHVPAPTSWIAMPDDVDRRVDLWRRDFSEWLEVEHLISYVGRPVWALTVTDPSVPPERKRAHLFDNPHAHEPACTAGQMNFLHQLLTGENLDGTPSDLPREEILHESIITFIPDCNPDGRSRSPEPYWDGTKHTNDDFWCFMRGRDPDTGGMWKRVDLWTVDEPHPEVIGIVYEQISETEYVEPNRHPRSSGMRLMRRLLETRRYDQYMHLHQTEFEKSAHNCMIILPVLQDELPEPIQRHNAQWADEVVAAWQEAGESPIPESRPLGYTGEQREYFVQRWGALQREMPTITSEVQNNSARTPPDMQRLLNEIAIRVTVTRRW